jgi:NAD(P)-dependent dehydrogenase (short-subunit alcohol dehydrogenase family)
MAIGSALFMALNNQLVVISGGASGLGKACAITLANKGYRVAAIDVNSDALSDLKSLNLENLKTYYGDITLDIPFSETIHQITQDFGCAIRIGIACAGIAPAKRIVGKNGPHELALFNKVIQVNLIGTFNLMRLCASSMMLNPPNAEGERGVFIQTASVAAYDGQIGQAAYSASKSGVVGMTLPAAREFAQFGIRVVTIAPGMVNTPMMAAMPESVQASLVSQIPFPKRFAKPEEYSSLVLEIINNSYLNGCTIRLDGAIRMMA